MQINLPTLDGYKTYISIFLYLLYSIAVKHGWIVKNPDIELVLQGAIAASFANKVDKMTTAVTNSTNPQDPIP